MGNAESVLANLVGVGGKLQEAPETTEYYTKHYQLIVGIGDDHTATVTFDEDSLKELCKNHGYELDDFIELEG